MYFQVAFIYDFLYSATTQLHETACVEEHRTSVCERIQVAGAKAKDLLNVSAALATSTMDNGGRS